MSEFIDDYYGANTSKYGRVEHNYKISFLDLHTVYWTNAKGERILLSELDEQYLENIINYIKKARHKKWIKTRY